MNKTIINVPTGITKLSQWPEFESYLPPTGKFVLNKKITGCGATTYYLENSQPVILCSHRTELLDCKAKSPRHAGKVHLFKSPSDSTKEDLERNLRNLRQYLDYCMPTTDPFGGVINPGMPPKILVTTDSLGHVVNILNEYNLLGCFTVISDECQCIFTDASFKGGSVLGYLGHLGFFNRVIFLSATPYLENYLDKIDTFKDLPYIELEWPADMVEDVYLTPYYVPSIKGALSNKIEFWLQNGYFEESGKGRATEAVFFINSVATIVSVIEKYLLLPSTYNIICSKSNTKTLKKLSSEGLEVGTAPKEGEPHKPITFVTKCAFEGVDFYHTNAYTYVFSNPNLQNLAVDLSIDLVQILGRQRLESNPWRNYATIYFGCTYKSSIIPEDVFRKNMEEKEEFTQKAIAIINNSEGHIKDKWIQSFDTIHTRDGYTREYVDILTDPVTGKVEAYSNNLVKVAETRAWDIRCNIYTSRYQILNNLQSLGLKINQQVINDLNAFFLEHRDFTERLEEYCRVMDLSDQVVRDKIQESVVIPKKFHEYYGLLGTVRCKALRFEEVPILNELNNLSSAGDIKTEVLKEFSGINKISKAEAKVKLQGIYDRLGLKKKAKATDLGEFFNIVASTLVNTEGKTVNCYKIISIK